MLDQIVKVRLDPKTMAILQTQADSLGVRLSTFVRMSLMHTINTIEIKPTAKTKTRIRRKNSADN